jgi:hypothetical protein
MIHLSNNGAAADFPVIDIGGGSQGAPITTDLTTSEAANIVSFDRRIQKLSALTVSSDQTPTGTALGGIFFTAIAAGSNVTVTIDEAHEIPLLPGMAIQYRSSIVNQASQLSFWWRERPIEEGETF